MRGLLVVMTILTLSLLGLAGCGNAGAKTPPGLNQIDADQIDLLTLHQGMNQDHNQSYAITDKKMFSRFVQAIAAAEHDMAKLDIAAPDYGATVEMKDGTSYSFSFWVTGGNTGLMIISGQNGHYRLPEASKQDLLDLFQSVTKELQAEKKVNFQVDDVQEITLAETMVQAALASEESV
ncbi:hypothetical protein [Paenibacillus mendelii]|uniref:YhfM-like domain-containing protein n=1 Tax=Paenibacillus mendelii TaxID=206163 RepID=A0ABV6J6X9_9BACL|nr:hypothetical protein [Paenibacillus mendelii]MCQ6560988.1 hypothetical protein [Paenibacillus mendelii]